MFVVLGLIFTVVVPRLEPLFLQAGDKLPWPAAILMAVAGFFNSYGTIVALVLAVGCTAYGFVDWRFFIGAGFVLAAVWYFAAIKWVDQNSEWP